jgi:hypothetical protein
MVSGQWHGAKGSLGAREKLTAWMAANAPANIREWRLLILGPVREVATRIPLVGLCVNLGVEMHVVKEVDLRDIISETGDLKGGLGRRAYSKSITGHDFSTIADRYVLPANILAEGGTDKLETDALAQAEIDQWEVTLPVVDGKRGENIETGLVRTRAILLDRGVDLGPHLLIPVRVAAEIHKHPPGIDAAVELAGEQRPEDELLDNVSIFHR